MKSKHIIISVSLMVIVPITAYFYWVLKTKIVNHKKPFSTFISQKFTLERDALLVKNLKELSYEHISKIIEKEKNIGLSQNQFGMEHHLKGNTTLINRLI